MVNFCLRESDTALSVQSRSKVLNAVTNNIFRVLIIGNDQLVNETIQSFDYFREVVDNTMCDLSKEIKSESKDELERACNQDQLTSRVFMDWLYDLISKGITHESMLGCTYDRGMLYPTSSSQAQFSTFFYYSFFFFKCSNKQEIIFSILVLFSFYLFLRL